jgi:hypothetical protein
MNTRRRFLSIFAVPLLIALVTIIGLVIALTGDGVRDVTSWVTLCVPIFVVGWAMKDRRT